MAGKGLGEEINDHSLVSQDAEYASPWMLTRSRRAPARRLPGPREDTFPHILQTKVSKTYTLICRSMRNTLNKAHIPKPVRSLAANNITKPATAPETSTTDNDGQMSSQMPSPRMFRRNGMSAKNAAEAYCLRARKARVKRQISILAHTRKEVKTAKTPAEGLQDKNEK